MPGWGMRCGLNADRKPLNALVPATLPAGAVLVLTGGVYRAEWCPRVCGFAPPFETLLGHEVEL